MERIVLKLVHGSVLKRIRKSPTSISHLEKIVCSEFPQLTNKALSFQYVDCDGDIISLTTQEGLKEAYMQLKEAKSKVLNLIIRTIDKKEENKRKDSISWDECLNLIVKEELNNKTEDLDAFVKKVNIHDSRIIQSTIHEGIKCSNCGVLPIRGIRYKCAECVGYNLCEVCESKEVHAQHGLLKLTNPEKKSDDGVEESKKKGKKKEKKLVKILEVAPCHKKAFKERKNEMMGVIIGSSTKEICGVAGELVIVRVNFKNFSEVDWPENVLIDKVHGRIPFESIPITEKLRPEEEIKLEILVELPDKIGSYTIKLRLKGDGKFFGQTIVILAEVHKENCTTCKKRLQKVHSANFA